MGQPPTPLLNMPRKSAAKPGFPNGISYGKSYEALHRWGRDLQGLERSGRVNDKALLPISERRCSRTDRHRFRSRKQLVERSRFACPMEIEWPGAKAQGKERGRMGVGGGMLEGHPTSGALGRGW